MSEREKNFEDVLKALIPLIAILLLTLVAENGGAASEPIAEGTNTLTPSMMDDIVTARSLDFAPLFDGPPTLAATMVSTGVYPIPRSEFKGKLRGTVEKTEGDVYIFAANRVQTKIQRANAIVIARGDLPLDSLAASAYGKSQGMPVLLTRPGDAPKALLDAIQLLHPTKIMVLGGENAVSASALEEINRTASQNVPLELLSRGEFLNVDVERVWGKTRYETAVEIAKKTGEFKTLVVTDGENPSIEAAIIGGVYNAPIIYVTQKGIPDSVKEFLAQRKLTNEGRPMKIVLVGVNEAVGKEVKNLTLSRELGAKLEVVLSNKDNNDVYVELYIDQSSAILLVESGVARSYGPIKLDVGDHVIKIKWLDPNTDETYEKQEKVTLGILEEATKTMTIDLHTLAERTK